MTSQTERSESSKIAACQRTKSNNSGTFRTTLGSVPEPFYYNSTGLYVASLIQADPHSQEDPDLQTDILIERLLTMTTINNTFLCLAMTLLVLALSLLYRHLMMQRTKFDDPAVCKNILAGKSYQSNSSKTNVLSRWASRAIPNQRLVRAFGIDNAFTTFDRKYHKEFVDMSKKKMDMSPSDWKRVVDLARQLILSEIEGDPAVYIHQLDDLVRSLCLKITLHIFFDFDPLELDNENALAITKGINDLWLESKTGQAPSKSYKEKLSRALANFSLPMDEGDSRNNALNVILPAYETLWRVVLSCFIEVTYRKGADQRWQGLMKGFADNPTDWAFTYQGQACENVTVEYIVKEALRLYPSTKSVYRTFQKDDQAGQILIAADIEGCHRKSKIWQPNPERFMPSRWLDISQEAERELFMPFGSSPFTCPAKAHYGPRIIASLVGALVTTIRPEEFWLWFYIPGVEDPKELNKNDRLIADRDAYERIEIVG